MQHQSVVSSVSWIPSEAIAGPMRVPFVLGIAHYDRPPPSRVDDLAALARADRFRFANELAAWIEVADGRVVDAGYAGGVHMGSSTLRVGTRSLTLPGVTYPTIQQPPEHGDGWVRFVQTSGGRTGFPLPRRVDRSPWVQVVAPTVWTTLALTLHVDGSARHELVGSSAFPRHWIHDADGQLVRKTGILDFRGWSGESFGERSPWGGHEQATLVAEAESELERTLSTQIMQAGARPEIRRLAEGDTLTVQGDAGDELFLLLDGVVDVEVDGSVVAEVGPGAVLGERAVLEGGRRTATLRARTAGTVAVTSAAHLDAGDLRDVAVTHDRERPPDDGSRDPAAKRQRPVRRPGDPGPSGGDPAAVRHWSAPPEEQS